MHLTKNGLTIEVPDAEVVNLVLERLADCDLVVGRLSETAQRIGAYWTGQGGIYAGIMRGREGAPDYHLIVGGAVGSMEWGKAMDAAASMEIDGHKDFTLPFRAEQALQFANVPDLFEQEYYWSCEQHADDAAYAWLQNFGNGGQYYWGKDGKLRARAVRRLTIQ
jgi:hypothetical protein